MNEENLLVSRIRYVSIIMVKAIATCTQQDKKYHVGVALYLVIVSDMRLSFRGTGKYFTVKLPDPFSRFSGIGGTVVGTPNPVTQQDHRPQWEKTVTENHVDKGSGPGHPSCQNILQICYKTELLDYDKNDNAANGREDSDNVTVSTDLYR
ncbi:hypothetical protein TURU_097641 [Turdus rufiventris]|nr:hypothetical protein TURU_097641 [Turdus rufiventris]